MPYAPVSRCLGGAPLLWRTEQGDVISPSFLPAFPAGRAAARTCRRDRGSDSARCSTTLWKDGSPRSPARLPPCRCSASPPRGWSTQNGWRWPAAVHQRVNMPPGMLIIGAGYAVLRRNKRLPSNRYARGSVSSAHESNKLLLASRHVTGVVNVRRSPGAEAVCRRLQFLQQMHVCTIQNVALAILGARHHKRQVWKEQWAG